MISYGDIIEEQRNKLKQKINWWPVYLYHFTDVNNAVNIIEKECIYGRNLAIEENLMNSNNASTSVINVTDDKVKSYARLYMRPKTPTQYHNEGYKPEHIRDKNVNANCPVPIFFILDAEKTLSMDDVMFIEKGLAGHYYNSGSLLRGEENYKNLNFDKIFHTGAFNPDSDIKQFRQTEVIRDKFIPISGIVRGIACRSIAEKQTLLYLLKKTSKNKYNKYKDIISFKPEIDLFYSNGIFIKNIKYEDDAFYFELNDNGCRYNADKSNGKDIAVNISIEWLGENFKVLARELGSVFIDYRKTKRIIHRIRTKEKSFMALIEVKFDGYLMYQNIVQVDSYELV